MRNTAENINISDAEISKNIAGTEPTMSQHDLLYHWSYKMEGKKQVTCSKSCIFASISHNINCLIKQENSTIIMEIIKCIPLKNVSV